MDNTSYSDDINGLSFSQDTEGNWGYKPSGADSVIPFKNKLGSIEYKFTLPLVGSTNGAGASPRINIPIELLKIYSKVVFELISSTASGGWSIQIYKNNSLDVKPLTNSSKVGTIYEYDLSTILDTDIIQLRLSISYGSGTAIIAARCE